MLQIRHLQVTMKKDLRPLLEDLNFTLQPGDKAAIIGEEGNGKSTLLKLLYDPHPGTALRRVVRGRSTGRGCCWGTCPRSCLPRPGS